MKVLKILLLSFLIVIFGACSTVQQNTLPEKAGVGYSWWKEAPSWMAKDFVSGGFGLIDGFAFEYNMSDSWAIKVDTPKDPEGLDGKCDHIAFIQDSGETGVRDQGYDGPLIRLIGSAPCEQWDEVRERILKLVNAKK